MKAPERLAAHLIRTRITQADFASIIGVSPASICRIVNGDRTPCLRSALAIERETGIPCAAWVA